MDFTTAVSSVLSKYVGFQGRARRSEYWWWALASFLIALVAEVLDRFVDPAPPGAVLYLGLIYKLTALALFLPSLAVGVRRLHDTDRSGFWFFIALVPIVGAILLLVWFCMKGTSGTNRFGPDPTA
jgi:uncharacterized membrane protein YhaH (DUF805 family)